MYNICMYMSKYVLIMCNSLKIIIKNTFSCCADILQPFTLTITAIHIIIFLIAMSLTLFTKTPKLIK